jgi:chromosome partitioning protein
MGKRKAKIISVALQKGGSGKTTVSTCVSAILGSSGKKVLLVDLDSQANTTYCSGVESPEKTVTDVLGGECAATDAVISCKYYDLLAADSFLVNAEKSGEVTPELLRNCLSSVKGIYDYILIDNAPSLGSLLYAALVASDYVLIPAESRAFAMQGLAALQNTILHVKCNHNPALEILGIVLVKYNPRSVLNRDLRAEIEEYAESINTEVFKTSIRDGIAVPESQAVRQPLIDYAPKSKPCLDFMELVNEILEKIGE